MCQRKSLPSGVCLPFGWIFWNARLGMCAVRLRRHDPTLEAAGAGYREEIPAFQPADVLFLDIREVIAETVDSA